MTSNGNMKKLFLKSILKKHVGICIGMTLVLSLGVGLLTGMNSFIDSLSLSLDNYIKEYNYPDVVITVEPSTYEVFDNSDLEIISDYASENDFNSLEEAINSHADKNGFDNMQEALIDLIKIKGGNVADIRNKIKELNSVEDINTRIIFDTLIFKEENCFSVRVHSYNDKDFIRFYKWEETERSDIYKNIYIENKFAQSNDIHIGDVVELRIDDKLEKFYIQSIISTPECMGGSASDSAGGNLELGYIYVNDKELNDYSDIFNQLLIKSQHLFHDDETTEEVKELLRKYNITVLDTCVYEDSGVKARIDVNVEPIELLCVILPFIFFVVIMIVIYLCFSILVRQCRRNIGVSRALGYNVKDITIVMMMLGGVIDILGLAIGIPLGQLIIKILGDFYADFFPLPTMKGYFDFKYLLIAFVASLIVSQGAIFINSLIIKNYKPVEVMARETSDSHEAPFLVRTLFKNTPVLFKFSLTTILRNKKQLVFSIICVASTMIILFCTISFRASFGIISTETYNKRINYDCLLFLNGNPDADFLEGFKNYVDDYELVKYYKKTISFNGHKFESTINAVGLDNTMVIIPDVDKIPDKGLVLESYIAKELGAKVGDIVSVGGVEMEVTALSKQYSNRISYISMNESNRFGNNEYGIVLCNTKDRNALLKYLADTDIYLSSCFTDDLYADATEMFESFYFVTNILMIFSVVIGTVIVLVNTKSTLIERKKEISVTRTLGHTVGSVSISFYIHTVIQLLLATLLCLPISFVMLNTVSEMVEGPRRTYPLTGGIKEVIITFFITLLYVSISHLLSMEEIKKWNLSENIKTNE